ncbi:MAG: hypothetical protein HY913_18575 [Desulfomonile tiedjei]|nr:hypothetical protein [Desulfomonile tiedjei]
MRKIEALVLFLSIFVWLLFGSCASGDSPQDSDISFSLPFECHMEEPYCLADSFKAGLNVVLVGKSGICSARTGQAFTYDHHVEEFEATRVVGTEKCPVVKDETPFREYRIAVVGADPQAVRPVSIKDDKSPVPKELELEARKLAAPNMAEPQSLSGRVPVSLSDAQPKVLRTENVTLLIFELQADKEPWEPGPTVALTDAGVFLLDGACTYGEPTFFSVNDKLYLTYDATVSCCGCGDRHFFVYDLSSGTPKMVYRNSKFAD